MGAGRGGSGEEGGGERREGGKGVVVVVRTMCSRSVSVQAIARVQLV